MSLLEDEGDKGFEMLYTKRAPTEKEKQMAAAAEDRAAEKKNHRASGTKEFV